jgi:hypothetical protein
MSACTVPKDFAPETWQHVDSGLVLVVITASMTVARLAKGLAVIEFMRR